ncbi:MAG: hypothetical protein LUO86_02505 [Methanomicrobiales archaeon]|nr:hypothetical protein [Methanomicrobiales archaeon]MDD1655639.1 hypothetical protein [Methanomicrobiales archaeon]
MMRPSSLYLLLALLALMAVLTSGCAMLGSRSSGGDASLTDITVYSKERSTLEKALEALRSDEQKGLVDLTGMELTQVMGIRVDKSGGARIWTLGYRGGNSTRILEYSGGKWTGVDVQIPLPEDRIPLDQLILPTTLFAKQKTAIGEAFSRRGVNESELILRGDSYTLTVPSPSGTTVLVFDARTGEVRPSP